MHIVVIIVISIIFLLSVKTKEKKEGRKLRKKEKNKILFNLMSPIFIVLGAILVLALLFSALINQ